MRVAHLMGGLFATIAILAAAVFLVRSADDDDPATVDLRIPCTNDATIEAARLANQRGFDEPTPAPFIFVDDELQCRIRRAILAPGDLGSDWRWEDFGGGQEGAQASFGGGPCQIASPYIESALSARMRRGQITPSDEVTPGTDPEDDFEALNQNLYVTADGRGPETFAALRRACAASPREGDEDSFWTEGASAPSVGDEAYGVRRFNVFDDDEPLTPENMLFVRYGDVIVELHHFQFRQDAPFDRVADIASRAGEKLEPHLALLDENRGAAPTPTVELAPIELALNAGLLSTDDVPGDWVLVDGAPSFELESLTFCADGRTSYPADVRATGRAFAVAGINQQSLLTQTVILYASTEAATGVVSQLRASPWYVESCSGRIDEDEVRWRFRPIQAEVSGDYAAWRAISKYCCSESPELADVPYLADRQFDWIAIQRGPLVALIVYASAAPRGADAVEFELTQPDSFILDELLPGAQDRLRQSEAAVAAVE